MTTAQPRRQMNEQDMRVVENTVSRHVKPIHDSIRRIELAIAHLNGSLDEHKSSVDKQLNTLSQTVNKSISTTGKLAGTVEHHEAELAELFRQGKGGKKNRFSFTPSHLTLALWLALGIVVIAGTYVGVDILELWK